MPDAPGEAPARSLLARALPRRRRLLTGVVLLLSFAAVLLYLWLRLPPVQVAEVRLETVVRTLALTGRVIGWLEVPLSANHTATVRVVFVDRGDLVQAGQLLAQLESDEERARLEAAQGRVAQAAASLELVREGAAAARVGQAERQVEIAREQLGEITRDLRDSERLLSQGLVSRQSVEQQRTRLSQAQARLEAAQLAVTELTRPRPDEIRAAEAQLETARAQLREARAALDKAAIRAPFTGRVLERSIDPGEQATAGKPLFVLQRQGPLKLEADLDEQYLSEVHPGLPAVVSPEATPLQRLPATLMTIDPRVDPALGAARIELALPPSAGTGGLRPGMTVDIDLKVAEEPDVLTVPRVALLSPEARTHVYLLRDRRAVRVPVRVIPWRAERVVVREGLQRGDLVIITPDRVEDGERVRVRRT